MHDEHTEGEGFDLMGNRFCVLYSIPFLVQLSW